MTDDSRADALEQRPAEVPEVSVVIPTIGRPAQLELALASLAGCRPVAGELVIVDQSVDDATRSLVQRYGSLGVRWIHCAERSIGRAINVGLREAKHDIVLVTSDDCVVAADWVAVAVREMARSPGGIVTGAVLGTGDAALTPSLMQDSAARDYTGTINDGALYGSNMVCSRAAVLGIGGFDERINPSAEDNDLCYRWLRAGGVLRYCPEMRVWHRDWRTPEQMRQVYRRYGEGQGVFYAKHLVAGDATMLRFLRRDLKAALPAGLGALRHGRRPPNWAQGMLAGLAVGLARGVRVFLGASRARGPRRPSSS